MLFVPCLLIILSVGTYSEPIKIETSPPPPIIVNNVFDMPMNISNMYKWKIKRFVKDINRLTNEIASGNYYFGIWLCSSHGLIQIRGFEMVESEEDVDRQIQSIIDKSQSNEMNLLIGLNETFNVLNNIEDKSLVFNFFYVGKSLRKEDWPNLNCIVRSIKELTGDSVYFINISENEEIKREFLINGYVMFDLLTVQIEVLYERRVNREFG